MYTVINSIRKHFEKIVVQLILVSVSGIALLGLDIFNLGVNKIVLLQNSGLVLLGILTLFLIIVSSKIDELRYLPKGILLSSVAVVVTLSLGTVFGLRTLDSIWGFDFESNTLISLLSFFVIWMGVWSLSDSSKENLLKKILIILNAFVLISCLGVVLLSFWITPNTSMMFAAGLAALVSAYNIDRGTKSIKSTALHILTLVASLLLLAQIHEQIWILGLSVVGIFVITNFVKGSGKGPIFSVVLVVALVLINFGPSLPQAVNSDLNPESIKISHTIGAISKIHKTEIKEKFGDVWLGWGPHSYTLLWDFTRKSRDSNSHPAWGDIYLPPFWDNYPKHTLGTITTSAFENGILGIIVWSWWLIALCLYFVSRSTLRMTKSDINVGKKDSPVLPIFFLVSIYGIFVINPSALIVITSAVAIGLYVKKRSSEEVVTIKGAGNKYLRFMIQGTMLVVFGIAVVYVIAITYSRFQYHQAIEVFSNDNEHHPEAENLLQKALYAQEHPRYYRALAQMEYLLLQSLIDNKENSRDEEKLERITLFLDSAISSAEKSVQKDELDYRNWFILGTINLIGYKIGHINNSEDVTYPLSRAQTRSLASPLVRYLLADFYYTSGDIEKAKLFIYEAYLRIKVYPIYQPIIDLFEELGLSEDSEG